MSGVVEAGKRVVVRLELLMARGEHRKSGQAAQGKGLPLAVVGGLRAEVAPGRQALGVVVAVASMLESSPRETAA